MNSGECFICNANAADKEKKILKILTKLGMAKW